MTGDELRAAAKRVTFYTDGPGRAVATADIRAVCQAYLADHPADDAEPVTADWLRAVGFVDYPRYKDCLAAPATETARGVGLPFTLSTGPVDNDWGIDQIGRDHHDYVALCSQPTRGHVRRLCAALGIVLSEPPARAPQ